MTPRPAIQQGQPVIARGGKAPTGKTTGVPTRNCFEGCTGRKVGVRWNEGNITYLCTRELEWTGEAWRLL